MSKSCVWCSVWPADYINDQGEEICAECAGEAVYDSLDFEEEE